MFFVGFREFSFVHRAPARATAWPWMVRSLAARPSIVRSVVNLLAALGRLRRSLASPARSLARSVDRAVARAPPLLL